MKMRRGFHKKCLFKLTKNAEQGRRRLGKSSQYDDSMEAMRRW
jgi:hypothetical protein